MRTFRVLVKEGYQTVKAAAAELEDGHLSFWDIDGDRVAGYAPGAWSLYRADGVVADPPAMKDG